MGLIEWPKLNNDKQTDGLVLADKFGTFGGVFTPCTLTILGVIMFLRFGQVVGNAGVLLAIVIVLLSKAITMLTSLSLSAVATNTRVKGGGAYFLISRSLGVEFGGAIGIVFYLAQAIAVAMYVIGFSEAFVDAFPQLGLSMRVVGTLVGAVIFVCAYVGAGWAIKVQYFILAILLLSLVSFLVGAVPEMRAATLSENWNARFSEGENFFTMFALFFPAVTGIMAGANMSGDLKNPSRSIPQGTIASVVVTGLVYVGLALVLGAARPDDELLANNLIMKDAARLPALVTAGIFAATLSSALASMMGAPRIMQALAKDHIFKSLRWFAAGSGKTGEPRRAVLLTFVIAQTAVLLGDLNAIAPIITMAFMITYGLINLATFYESITRNPSFRPRFRWAHWSLSLMGAVGCLVVMCLIAPVVAVLSIVAMGVLHWSIARREIRARWGDTRRGVVFERARTNLLKLEEEEYHPKNWRPIILALSGGGGHRPHLAVYGQWLTAGHGVLTLGQVIPGEVEDHLQRRSSQLRLLKNFIQEEDLQAFAAVAITPDISEGIEQLVQLHGIGGFRPNTVLMGYPGDEERAVPFGTALRIARGLGQSSIVIYTAGEIEDPWEAPPGSIHVWWRGEANGSLMLLLAHLLMQNSEWRWHELRLLRIIASEAGRQEANEHLSELIETSRIEASSAVFVSDDPTSVVHDYSQNAALVFLGFGPPEVGEEIEFWNSLQNWAGTLERVIFVHSAGGMELEA